MSNKKKAKHQSKKNSVAKNIAGGAVGTIFNVVLIIVAVMLIYYFAVSAYKYGVRKGPGPGRETVLYSGALIQLFRGRLCGGRLCAFHCDDAG